MYVEPYIKICTNLIREWHWFNNPNVFNLYIHCRILLNHNATTWQGIEIPKNSFITSYENLSLKTGMSISKIRTALKNLMETQDITCKSTNRNTIITVVNFFDSPNLKKPAKAHADMQSGKNSTTGNNKSISCVNKDKYGEFQNVKLTKEEHKKLQTIYKTDLRFNAAIEILSNYIESKGKDKYKSHYAVLNKNQWVYEKINLKYPLIEQSGGYNAFA